MCLSQMSIAGLIGEIKKERDLLVAHTERLKAVYDELDDYKYVLTPSEEVVYEGLDMQLDSLYKALDLMA